MNLKILFMLLIYYAVLSLFFLFGSATFIDYEANISLNDTELQSSEFDDTAGLWTTGVSFSRFFKFIGFGVGLPDSTPSWFSLIFVLWQTIVTIFTVGFVISSIWNG